MKAFFLLSIFIILTVLTDTAYAQKMPCNAHDIGCLSNDILTLADNIENAQWRDQIYRDVSKSMAAAGRATEALPLIAKITNPDTKALTIRGIGIEAAMADAVPEGLFVNLRTEAEKISEPAAYGIALTYIAMAQAYAGDNDGAMQTASEMQNEDLRNKAYGETAEIQAEKGLYDLAIKSIAAIESLSFKNKAYKSISKIFAENKKYQDAYKSTLYINNPVMKAEAIQFILDQQQHHKEKSKKEPDT